MRARICFSRAISDKLRRCLGRVPQLVSKIARQAEIPAVTAPRKLHRFGRNGIRKNACIHRPGDKT